MQSLQNIAIINGRPTIWGDAAPGLVFASGLLEDMEEGYRGEAGTDAYRAYCRVKRFNIASPVEHEFSMADAKQADLLGKKGPWQQYPKRMLQMRARGFALRDLFADVLKGMHIAEEMIDITPVETNRPEVGTISQADVTPGDAAAEDTPPQPKPEPTPEPEQETETAPADSGEQGLF